MSLPCTVCRAKVGAGLPMSVLGFGRSRCAAAGTGVESRANATDARTTVMQRVRFTGSSQVRTVSLPLPLAGVQRIVLTLHYALYISIGGHAQTRLRSP